MCASRSVPGRGVEGKGSATSVITLQLSPTWYCIRNSRGRRRYVPSDKGRMRGGGQGRKEEGGGGEEECRWKIKASRVKRDNAEQCQFISQTKLSTTYLNISQSFRTSENRPVYMTVIFIMWSTVSFKSLWALPGTSYSGERCKILEVRLILCSLQFGGIFASHWLRKGQSFIPLLQALF